MLIGSSARQSLKVLREIADLIGDEKRVKAVRELDDAADRHEKVCENANMQVAEADRHRAELDKSIAEFNERERASTTELAQRSAAVEEIAGRLQNDRAELVAKQAEDVASTATLNAVLDVREDALVARERAVDEREKEREAAEKMAVATLAEAQELEARFGKYRTTIEALEKANS